MKKILLCFAAILLCVSAGCSAKSVTATIADEGLPLSEMIYPPTLTLVCGDREVRALCPRCQWNRPDGTAVLADGASVFELWLSGDLEPLTVMPGDTVELRFDKAPDRFSVTAWKAECATHDRSRYDEKIDVTIKDDGTFTLPSDSTYIYALSAEWDQQGKVGRDASYAFATYMSGGK